MSEWRTLPEFPTYEITEDGDVRNKGSKRKLKEVQNKKTGAWSYSLRKEDGRSTCRNFWGLIYSAWPEAKPEEEPKEPKPVSRYYATRGQWVDIPDFPRYQAHPAGHVRYKQSRKRREIHMQAGEPYVKLIDQYGRHKRYIINELMSDLFPTKEAA